MLNTVDLHLGRRLRTRRRLLCLTQSDLASACGLQFQQIQKYESGANRMSAARLWQLSQALGVGVAYFYDGLLAPLRPGPTGVILGLETAIIPQGAAR